MQGVVMEELRALLPRLPADQLAVGGHAVALSQWHAVRRNRLKGFDVYQKQNVLGGQVDAISQQHEMRLPWANFWIQTNFGPVTSTGPPASGTSKPGFKIMNAFAILHAQAHAFCGRCGALTEPIQAGGKRRCTADPRHREYPRTDPVVPIYTLCY